MRFRPSATRGLFVITAAAAAAGLPAAAQSPTQVVKPPQAQVWIDVATYSGFGMPAGMGAGEGANPLAMLGGLFSGGGKPRNNFGNTQSGGAGRWVDVTLSTRLNPSLAEGQQAVPPGFMSPALKLQVPKFKPGAVVPPEDDDNKVVEQPSERPRGRLLLYWGCGASIRPGQPKVLDMDHLSPADMAAFFVSRRATQRGTHAAPGRPVWPSVDDARMVPAQASLVGEHVLSGQGVPEGFRFQIPPAQDLMPSVALQQQTLPGGGTLMSWPGLPTARAYFLSGMGGGAAGAGGEGHDVVFWSSSELVDTGMGLMDYQTNAAVDRWLKDKVLLPPATTQCQIPKGVFPGEAAMLRMIAYGSELNLAQPPRPADPRQPWEPVWAAKIRVKSVSTVMLGMPAMSGMGGGAAPAEAPAASEAERTPDKPKALDLLKGLLGR